MTSSRWASAIAFGILVGLGSVQGTVHAQVNPPYVNIPGSGVAMGEVVTISGGNLVPGSVVLVKLTGPSADSWTRSVGVGANGQITYPVQFNEQGMYKLELLNNSGSPLAMIMVSSGRR